MPARLAALTVVATAALAAACSSGSHGAGGAGGTGPGTSTPSPPADAAVATAPTPDAAPGRLGDAECEQLIDHVLDLQIKAQRAQKQADEVPTDEQIAKVRATMRDEMLEPCLTAWDRPSFDCLMAAKDVDALYACAGPTD